MQSACIRTRIAPTPSGFLHLGNIYSFVITSALARKHHSKILLRIDDLDQLRVNKSYIQDIFDTLNFLQIPWNEGPKNETDLEQKYSQTHRLDKYKQALDKLSDGGHVFACTCSRQQINYGEICHCFEKHMPLNTPNASWRLYTGNDTEVSIKNYDGGLVNAVLPIEMKNFVVKKKDGFPAYQLTSLVDDLFYGIDLIVRGQDLWLSTIAQMLLANILGEGNIFGTTTFYHHPLIMETPGKKLSKSAGATSVKYLRENGKNPAEIFALIAAMAGIRQKVSSWEELGNTFIDSKDF